MPSWTTCRLGGGRRLSRSTVTAAAYTRATTASMPSSGVFRATVAQRCPYPQGGSYVFTTTGSGSIGTDARPMQSDNFNATNTANFSSGSGGIY